MNRSLNRILIAALALALLAGPPAVAFAAEAWSRPATARDGPIVVRTVMVEDKDEDPTAAGRAVAEQLLAAMEGVAPKLVIVSECFEEAEDKAAVMKGIHAVIAPEVVVGLATYGSFVQQGCTDYNAVGVVGIGGEGIGISAVLVTELDAAHLDFEKQRELVAQRLRSGGEALAKRLARSGNDRLAIVLADAHSPKNQFLVEGVQRVLGPEFAITGGSANRLASKRYVYFGGGMHEDAALALMLSGNFHVSLAGRWATDHEKIVQTGREAAAAARKPVVGDPLGVLAFNCGGRRSRVARMEDELAAIQAVLGAETALFGCYCAGEVGPLDPAEPSSPWREGVFSGGSGWHLMMTILSR